jgi:hypothetical protein
MFYELMVDTQYNDKGELKPTLILRPKPFGRSPDCAIKDIIAEEDDPEENGTAVMETKFPDDFVVSAEIESSQKGWFTPLKDEAYDNTVSLYWDNEKTETKITRGKDSVMKDKKIIKNKFLTRITNESYHTVYEDEVYDESPTTSILDIVNFITMHPTKDLLNNSVLMKYGYLFPLIDLGSIKRYGMRKLEGWTNLWKDTEDPYNKKKKGLEKEQGTLDEAKLKELDLRKPTSKDYIVSAVGINYRARRDQLFNWNRFNPVYVTDNKVIRGRDKYRKGDKIYFPDEMSEEGYKGMFYYIKRVNQRVVIRENSTEHLTVLGLVRGGNEEYLHKYYLAEGGNDNVVRINAAWKEGEGAGNKEVVEEETELEFGNLTGDAKDFYEYMTNTKGIKKNNALGLLANIHRETSPPWNPNSINRTDPNGGSYGIFQWNNTGKGGRAANMFSHVPDWKTNWQAQIDYIYIEPTDGGNWKKIALDYLAEDFGTPEAAALEWMNEWEKTAHPGPDQIKHKNYLKSLKIKEVEPEPEEPEELTNEEKRKIKRRESGGKVGGKQIYNLTQKSIDKAYECIEAVGDSYTTLFDKYKNDENLSFAADKESIVMAISDIVFNSTIGDGDFVVSLIHNETKSGGYYTKGAFDPLAISHSGCCGLGQISQGTGRDCGIFSGYENRILKNQQNNKSINDIRHHPILNLKGIFAILYMKNWNARDLKSRVVAVCRYGDPNQSSYFEKATALLETTKPDHEFLTDKARNFASKWYAWYHNKHG